MFVRLILISGIMTLCGCATLLRDHSSTLYIPRVSEPFMMDGILDETFYRENPARASFTAAGNAQGEIQQTRVWLGWNEERLVCAFQCEDITPAWAEPSTVEKDVDFQDRCELFLWNGDPEGAYFCIEAAPGGAVHDYQAKFYRKFDDSWSPAGGWSCKAMLTPAGYTVEMMLPRVALEAMGIDLKGGESFKIGLFRADYDRYDGEPVWITWRDYGGKPDFHIAPSFGAARLVQ